MELLTLDVGICTGFAVVDSKKFPHEGGIISEGTLKISELNQLEDIAGSRLVIAEMPLSPVHAGTLAECLRSARKLVREYALGCVEIKASEWKRYAMIRSAPLPPPSEGVKRTEHARDALRIAIWAIRNGYTK